MNRETRHLALIALAAGGLPFVTTTSTHASVIVNVMNDTFDVGAPPTRLDDAADPIDRNIWLGRGAVAVAADGGDNSAFATGDTILIVPFSPITLSQPGHSISFKLDFRFVSDPGANSPGAPQFGLFNSQATLVTSDATQANSNDDKGYYATYRVATTALAGQGGVGDEAGGLAPILGNSDRVGRSTIASYFLNRNDFTFHVLELIATRLNATDMRFDEYGDGVLVSTFTTGGAAPNLIPNFTFDQVAFRSYTNGTSQNAVDNLIVTAVIPEPATAALLIAPLAMLARRRRTLASNVK